MRSVLMDAIGTSGALAQRSSAFGNPEANAAVPTSQKWAVRNSSKPKKSYVLGTLVNYPIYGFLSGVSPLPGVLRQLPPGLSQFGGDCRVPEERGAGLIESLHRSTGLRPMLVDDHVIRAGARGRDAAGERSLALLESPSKHRAAVNVNGRGRNRCHVVKVYNIRTNENRAAVILRGANGARIPRRRASPPRPSHPDIPARHTARTLPWQLRHDSALQPRPAIPTLAPRARSPVSLTGFRKVFRVTYVPRQAPWPSDWMPDDEFGRHHAIAVPTKLQGDCRLPWQCLGNGRALLGSRRRTAGPRQCRGVLTSR